MNKAINILLCEDDVNLALVMSDYLRERGYSVTHALNGQEGLDNIKISQFDLCLTDVMMPTMSGVEMTRELRETGNTLPIIIISQHGEKDDILDGYNAGCDDYVIKPVSMDILICKIEAILRRLQIEQDNQQVVYQLGDVVYDSVKQTIGQDHLSGRENDLLLMLCRRTNRLVERSAILKALWHEDTYFSSRSLSVYINHLRKRLNKLDGVRILAIHSKGYKLVVE